MSKPILSAAAFHNERAAYRFVEARIWPNGPVRFHCGAVKKHIGKLRGKSTRIGLYKCYACRKPFTVKMGTMLESSHVPMRLWLQAIYLLCADQRVLRLRMPRGQGLALVRSSVRVRELQHTLGVGLKTAWSMSHRIRAARKDAERRPPGRREASGLTINGVRKPKPKPKFDHATQSHRFIDMAREMRTYEHNDTLVLVSNSHLPWWRRRKLDALRIKLGRDEISSGAARECDWDASRAHAVLGWRPARSDGDTDCGRVEVDEAAK